MDTPMRRLTPSSPEFPLCLKEIPDPPTLLYIKGTLPDPNRTLAIVGTRRATPAGKMLARKFAQALVTRGFTIMSGLAFGIDAAAHEGALEAGGNTTAIMPCGLDHIYPRSHTRLARNMLESGGALISEYAPETLPL